MSIEADATHKNFRAWLNGSSPTEEMWDKIMEEDELYDYCSPLQDQNTTHNIVGSEVNVYTCSGVHDTLDTNSGEEVSDAECT